MSSHVDYLDEDEVIPSQQFVCLSFLSPEKIDPSVLKNKDTTMRGLKVRGVFATLDEAKAFSLKLRDKDPYFNIFVGPVGKWLPWDSTEHTEEENYQEKELNDLMQAYKKNQELSKKEIEKKIQEAKNNSQKQKKKKKKSLKKPTIDESSDEEQSNKEESNESTNEEK